MSEPNNTGTQVRALAARLNAQVVDGGRSLSQIEREEHDLPERDRPLLRALLAASLRWHHRLDWQLGCLLDRPLARRDRLLGSLLRVGLTQLQFLRIPEHAAVSATVAATAALGLSRARGLTNAILRRFIRERSEIEQRMVSVESAYFSHPEWLINALKHDWPDDWRGVLEAGNVMPPLWLRSNRRRIDRDAYLQLLAAAGMQATGSEIWPDAVLLADPVPVDQLPGFADGLVSVQDAAAQHVVDLVDPQPGMRVLDACAAPGGKTAHLLERCPELEEVVAVDSDGQRLAQVRGTLDRLRLSATVVEGDAAQPDAWFTGRPFDRILVDAPCSATGVVRRHPDIKLLRRATDLDELTRTQSGILDALWPLLSPGGRLVYATCSVLRRENDLLVEGFAAGHADAELSAFGTSTHRQLLPGQANTDGFYYACLSRSGSGN